jgi:hypothetical protein
VLSAQLVFLLDIVALVLRTESLSWMRGCCLEGRFIVLEARAPSLRQGYRLKVGALVLKVMKLWSRQERRFVVEVGAPRRGHHS